MGRKPCRKFSSGYRHKAEENSKSESAERQEEGLQALFDGEIDSSDSDSDKLDAIGDEEGDL